MKLPHRTIGVLALIISCTALLQGWQKDLSLLHIPPGFPQPVIPEDNALSEARIELGEALFFDPILSRDQSISCASCHHPKRAFSDTVALSQGIEGRIVARNSPTLINVAYQPRLMRDGGVPSLEMQVLVPIQEHREFDFNILRIAERLKDSKAYVQLSKRAYDREPDAFVITHAIAAFERSLIKANSAYDRYRMGDEDAMTASAKRGEKLFRSDRLQCNQCHSGLLFTDFSYQNNGLYVNYADSGRARVTRKAIDRAYFKVPTLRNVAVTEPYMHNGSMPDLKSVIRHYAAGGKAHPHKSDRVQGFTLSPQEESDLLAFLQALTDQEYLQ